MSSKNKPWIQVILGPFFRGNPEFCDIYENVNLKLNIINIPPYPTFATCFCYFNHIWRKKWFLGIIALCRPSMPPHSCSGQKFCQKLKKKDKNPKVVIIDFYGHLVTPWAPCTPRKSPCTFWACSNHTTSLICPPLHFLLVYESWVPKMLRTSGIQLQCTLWAHYMCTS